ncbi:hypothetical protein [Marinomonas sp.]
MKNLRYLQKVFRVSLKTDPRLIISICAAYLVGSALAEGGIDGNQAQSCNPKINSNIIVSVANENLRYRQHDFRVSLKANLRLIISICEANLVGSALAEGGVDGNQAQSCNSKIN